MERRPTQANPGKGCYWALVSGTEHIFIENLTQEYGHSRKHHDIGLTADLSVNQRRGACYYRNNHAESSSKTLQPDTELLDTPSKANLSRRSSSSPLYTTFRMTPGKSSIADDSDNDSGVDVSHERIDRKQLRKRRRTRNNTEITVQDGKVLQHVETSMVQDTSFGLMPDSSMNFEINNWIENYQQPMPSWCDSTVDTKPKKSPITIHLDDVTQFLHFDQENLITFETNYSSLYPSYYHYDYSLDNSTTLSNPCHLQQFVSMRDILYS